MYQVTQEFKDNSMKHGRLLDVRLSFDNKVVSGEDVSSIEKEFEVVFLGTSSQKISGEIVGRYDLTDSVIRVEVGIAYKESPFSYVDYGFFIVKEHERIVGAKGSQDKTTFVAYDIMLNAHELYDVEKLNATYPISVFNLYKAIATYIGTEITETSVVNGNMMIEEDKYTNIENVTYRNVLDDLSATMGASIIVSKNKLLAKYANAGMLGSTNVDSLHENNMRSLSIKDKMKPINILNLTREEAHDNYPYPLNWETIPVNDRSEIIVSDNQIMDKRRSEYAPSLFNAIKGLSYTPFDSETYGVLYLEPLDTIEVIDMNEVSHVSLVTSNRLKFTSGIKETLTSELPSKLKEKYALVTDNERQSMRVYFLVDKQNGIIQGLVEELGEVKDQTAELTIKVDEIELKVTNTSNGSVIGNLNPQDYTGWEGGSRLLYVAEYSKLRYLSGLTYAMGFQPVKFPQSLSEWGLSFFNNGSATSPFGYVVPTEKYSFKSKVPKFKPFTIDLLEYENMTSPFHKSTRFTFTSPQAYVQFTSELDPSTVFVRLRFNITGVTPSDRFEITELMYNRGLPKEYFVSGTEALVYAQSSVTLLNNRIGLVVDEVKIVDDKTIVNKGMIEVLGGEVNINAQSISGINNDIHNAGVEINAVEGVTTYGKKFEVMSEDKNTSYMKVTDNGVESHKMTAVDMVATNAKIQSGKIAGFDITGNNLVGEDISLTPKKILIGNSEIVGSYLESTPSLELYGRRFNFTDRSSGDGGAWIFLNDTRLVQKFGNKINLYADRIQPSSLVSGFGNLIGAENSRYDFIYLKNQPNVSSDKNLKYNISNIDEMLLDSFEILKEKSYKTKHDDKHSFGYIAQDVESCLYDYVNKVWDKEEANKQMNDFKLLSRESEFMSLLYIEVMIIMQAVERRRNDRLEERLNKLEELLKKEGK